MQEVFLDPGDQAFEDFRKKLSKYMDYLEYLEDKARLGRLTPREREVLKRHGKKSRGIKKSG